MTANLDWRGRAVRAASGVLCAAAGLSALAAGWPASPAIRWMASIVAIAAGGFQLFEAVTGW